MGRWSQVSARVTKSRKFINVSYFPICYSIDTYKWCIWYFNSKKILRASRAHLLYFTCVPFLSFGDPALFLPWIRPWHPIHARKNKNDRHCPCCYNLFMYVSEYIQKH